MAVHTTDINWASGSTDNEATESQWPGTQWPYTRWPTRDGQYMLAVRHNDKTLIGYSTHLVSMFFGTI